MSKKIEVYQLVARTEPIQVDASDVITLREAAKMMGVSLPVISGLLDNRQLPTILAQAASEDFPKQQRVQRYTLRSAVDKRIKEKGVRGKVPPANETSQYKIATKRPEFAAA